MKKEKETSMPHLRVFSISCEKGTHLCKEGKEVTKRTKGDCVGNVPSRCINKEA